MVEGVDGNDAYRQLGAIMGSYQPQHVHKIAGVAYLASLWFTKVIDMDTVHESVTVAS